jgi:hypothetical protein
MAEMMGMREVSPTKGWLNWITSDSALTLIRILILAKQPFPYSRDYSPKRKKNNYPNSKRYSSTVFVPIWAKAIPSSSRTHQNED